MRTLFFLVILLQFFAASSQVKKIQAETSIENVTVFSSGARIERKSMVSILPGRTEISFPSLSNQLDQQSVQLKADADITLLSVQSTKDYLSQRKIDQDEKSFIDRTNVLKDKIDLDQKLLEVYKNEEAMLIKNQAIGGTNGVKTTELKDALDLQRQRLTEVYQKQLEIQKRLSEEQTDSEKFKSQLKEISKKRDSINYIVTALVESKEMKNVTFKLLYNIKDAGWYPTYDVRINEVTEPLKVLMNANIFQRSGETWKDISLILSTGNPNDNATPSPLQPWTLGFFDPTLTYSNQGIIQGAATGRVTNDKGEPLAGASVNIKGTAVGAVTDANGYFKIQNFKSNSRIVVSEIGYIPKELPVRPGYYTISLDLSSQSLSDVVVTGYSANKRDLSIATEDVEAKPFIEKKESIQNVAVATQYQPTATQYEINEKYSVETDGKTTTIGIKQFDIAAQYDYFTVPKIDPSAFLTAKIMSWQNYDLQSGEASLYYEGTYLGKTYIDLGTVSDTLSLSLGKDNSIKVSRRLIKEYSSKRFIGNSRTETKQFEINLKNTKQVAVNLIINDQFPVSITKEIDVEDQKAPDAQVDKETGIITWVITLQPGQEKKLGFGYSVKYPKDKKVILE
jgi:Domain of unknown function (DUF4139)/N-terminal domain of unknown function (DUF4140)